MRRTVRRRRCTRSTRHARARRRSVASRRCPGHPFGMVADSFCSKQHLWLWVPAFAGTTNVKHTSAFSPRENARALPTTTLREGAGNAGCALHPQSRVQKVKSTRGSHHRFTGAVRHSPRNGFNGFLRDLPGDRALLSPSSAGHYLPT